MPKEADTSLESRLVLLPSAGDSGVREATSLEKIFKGREYLLCNLTFEQMYYLRFVVTYRLLKAGGDGTKTESLLRLLNKEEAERIASQLEE